MKLYCGIDLHCNNAYVTILDERDRVVWQGRLPNDLERIVSALAPHRESIVGVALESTYNWYWLADGLIDVGFRVHLANTNAAQQYNGLKHVDDRSDARWLAHLLRLGLLPEGYLYPRRQRGLRDLLRKRARLVSQRTANLLSLHGIVLRHTGQRINARSLYGMDLAPVLEPLNDPAIGLSVDCTRRVVECLDDQIRQLESEVLRRLRPDARFPLLKSIAGVGDILAPMILLETGPIERFATAGNYVSYCRMVKGQRLSNARVKGKTNAKNGNPHLAWAWMEAANFAIRFYKPIRRYNERKQARTHRVVALKTVAHKLARAGYYVLRDRVPFQLQLAFG